MPDPLVLRCPHCQHLLHLPEEYLGKIVSCLECKQPFRAPIREHGVLTQPQALPKARGVPARFFIPVFGLLLLGTAGTAVNAYFLADNDAAKQYVNSTLDNLFTKEPPEAKDWKAADANAKTKPDEAELKRREEVGEKFRREQHKKLEALTDSVPMSKGWRVAGLVTSLFTLLGGVAFLVRRGYMIALVGCIAAAVNSPYLGCCFIGGIVAIWSIMALISEEGRQYFGRSNR